MAVAALSQAGIYLAGAGILLHEDHGGVKGGVAEAAVTGPPHGYQAGFAALLRDGSDSRQGTQSVIISMDERRECLREHRSGEDSPESGDGTENLDATMLGEVFVLGQVLQELLDAAGQIAALLVEEFQARQQQQELLGQG